MIDKPLPLAGISELASGTIIAELFVNSTDALLQSFRAFLHGLVLNRKLNVFQYVNPLNFRIKIFIE
jgi:hypothetical protein